MYLFRKCLDAPGPSGSPSDNSGIWRGWPPHSSPNSNKRGLASPWASKALRKVRSSLPHLPLPSPMPSLQQKIRNHMCFPELAKFLKPLHILFLCLECQDPLPPGRLLIILSLHSNMTSGPTDIIILRAIISRLD